MYKIKSNLSEKQIEADVANYFGWISENSPFRLLDIDEQLTGADKIYFDSGFLFFIQFKKSEGLKPICDIPASARKNRSKLEDIREFRDVKGLDDDPTLYFKLRKMAKNATDFQHNILLKYANQPSSQAFYVAPLHLDKDEYYKCLFDSTAFSLSSVHTRFLKSPFTKQNIYYYGDKWISLVKNIPYLKEHVSIVPHEPVTDYRHFYSYSSTGCDIGWHSPELLNESPSRLSDLLSYEINKCINENRFINLSELNNSIYLPEDVKLNLENFGLKENEFPIDSIQMKGKLINEKHKIRMFTLLTNRKLLSSYKEQIEFENRYLKDKDW
ncbi:hypothetical protein [Vagococcus carniphilus]|uniref:hypothetical protein n=1 Tax=Vagococcus carniphilus TaxID=218144 RepID=UPI0028900660|nr:hypothetical protein [Vagococcus carniphilus]MDT2815256.1 hypothetical protein [Vagococcus carniphilus]MDT2866511.1 hypothetical protein [Vagococcus carniphilus]